MSQAAPPPSLSSFVLIGCSRNTSQRHWASHGSGMLANLPLLLVSRAACTGELILTVLDTMIYKESSLRHSPALLTLGATWRCHHFYCFVALFWMARDLHSPGLTEEHSSPTIAQPIQRRSTPQIPRTRLSLTPADSGSRAHCHSRFMSTSVALNDELLTETM